MAASIRLFDPSKLRACPVAVCLVQKRASSTSESISTTKLTSLKRGTGGRSSFSGVVATLFGASGFLGRHVCNKLGKVGSQIIIPYRSDHYTVLNLKLCGDLGQILYQPFNLKNEEELYKAMKYSNVVINLIGSDNETSNFSFEDVHVTAARNIARIAKECGVQRLIHVSALNACEHPTPIILKKGSQFLASKWRGEQAVREEFPQAIIFRPSDIYGQQDRFLFYYAGFMRHQYRLLPLWKKGKNVIKQPVYVGDLATGIVNSIFEKNSPGQIYEGIGPNRYELKELIDWFHRVMRKTDEYGFRVTDMRFDPIFWLKVSISEKLFFKYPTLTWERVEREHVTDTLTPGLPNLEDLGVALADMDERLAYDLEVYRALTNSENYGAYDRPKPAPVVA